MPEPSAVRYNSEGKTRRPVSALRSRVTAASPSSKASSSTTPPCSTSLLSGKHNAKEAPEPWTHDRSGDRLRPCVPLESVMPGGAPPSRPATHPQRPADGRCPPPGCTGHRRIASL